MSIEPLPDLTKIQIQKLQNEIDRLQSDYTILEENYEKLKKEFDLQSKLDRAYKQIQRLEKCYNEMQSERDQQKEENNKLRKEKVSWDIKKDVLKKINELRLVEILKLQNTINEMKKDKEEIVELKKKNADLEEEVHEWIEDGKSWDKKLDKANNNFLKERNDHRRTHLKLNAVKDDRQKLMDILKNITENLNINLAVERPNAKASGF